MGKTSILTSLVLSSLIVVPCVFFLFHSTSFETGFQIKKPTQGDLIEVSNDIILTDHNTVVDSEHANLNLSHGGKATKEIEELEEEEEEEVAQGWAAFCVLVIVTCLIFVTIFFEHLKHNLEHSVDEELKPVLEHLFGELTVLGFIGLSVFAVSKVGILSTLSVTFFGEDEFLQELTEVIHMVLFFGMILFLFQVVVLLRFAAVAKREWTEYEKPVLNATDDLSARNSVKEEAEELGSILLRSSSEPFFSLARWIKLRRQTLKVEFLSLREAFIRDETKPKDSLGTLEERVQYPPSLKHNRRTFELGHYFSLRLDELISELVEVPASTWFILLAAFVPLTILSVILGPMGGIVLFIFLFYSAVVVLYVIHRKLRNIITQLTPQIHFHHAHNLAFGTRAERDQLLFAEPNRLPHPPYLWQAQTAVRAAANHRHADETPHDSLFWEGAHGPHLLLTCLRSSFLLIAFYIGVFIVVLIPSAVDETGVLPILIAVALTSFAMFAAYLIGTIVLRDLVIATSVEMHKSPKHLLITLRALRTARLLRLLSMLHTMYAFARTKDQLQQSSGGGTSEPPRAVAPTAAESKKNEDLFKVLDRDGSGKISTEELERVFSEIFSGIVEKSAITALISSLDSDKSGFVELEELNQWLSQHDGGRAHTESPHELVEGLFSILDKDGSGTISVAELTAVIDLIDPGSMTPADMVELFNDMDANSDGVLGKHEFHQVVVKHLEMF